MDAAARSAELARAITRASGAEPLRIFAIVGRGQVNYVFAIDTPSGKWIVRFPREPLDADQFPKEAFCLLQARRAGIPSPDLIAVGRFGDLPYIVQSCVEGAPGTSRPDLELWTTLGRHARTIHGIPLGPDAPDALFPRFGRELDENWRRHVDYNLEMLTLDDPLLALGAYPPSQQRRISDVFARLGSQALPAGLDHGDLVPQNVLLPATGPPVVIDWGSASAAPIPHTALLRLWEDYRRTGAPDLACIGAFAAGLQIDLATLIATLDDMLLLEAIDRARWALDRRPDRLGDLLSRARSAVQARFGS